MEGIKEKRLRLWKARQEAEGYDVSGVTTLEEAEHFFDKKDKSKPVEEPEAPEVQEEPEKPKKRASRKAKEV